MNSLKKIKGLILIGQLKKALKKLSKCAKTDFPDKEKKIQDLVDQFKHLRKQYAGEKIDYETFLLGRADIREKTLKMLAKIEVNDSSEVENDSNIQLNSLDTLKEHFNILIAQNKLELIFILLKGIISRESAYWNILFIRMGRYNALKRQMITNTITKKRYKRGKEEFKATLITIIDAIKNKDLKDNTFPLNL